MTRLSTQRAASLARGSVALALAIVCLLHTGHAYGDGIAGLMVSKSIPAATIAVIDPESGTSSGGGTGTDLRLAPGDVILFRLNYFAMPDRVMRGVAGYLTEFIPPNTEVVGIRILDSTGRTVEPNYPGLAMDGCAGGACGGFDAVPCSAGVTGCVGGERNLADGSIAQLYADTGIFYSTDSRTARAPSTTFISYTTGYRMWEEPISAPNIAPILGVTSPFFAHTQWDFDQIVAYGISNSQGNASDNGGSGNTPFRYGSAVAGPDTYYRYEATDVVADPTLTSWNMTDPNDWDGIRFDDVTGPWQRVRYAGSLIGTGAAVTGVGAMTRRVLDASTVGFDVRPANPIPVAANALRVALGELRAGEQGTVEVALRVIDTPIDPVQMADVDCAEMYGGGTSAENPGGTGTGGKDEPWGFVIPSPACVFLNNQFDLTVDRGLATGGQTLTYTLHGKNLSTLPQTGVVVTQDYDGSRVSFVSATGAATSTTCGGRPCLSWTLGTLDPGEEYTFTSTFTVGGTGQISVVSYANYRSTQLPAPGFTTQALTLVRSTPVIRATLAPSAASVAAGGTIVLAGTLTNAGTADASLQELSVTLSGTPAGWRLTPAQVTISGTNYTTGTGSTATAGLGGLTLAAGASRPITMTVTVPAGTATGLYDVDLSVWGTATGYGGQWETFFNDITQVPVGAVRSTPPVITCPVLSSQTTITGTTTEASGTDVRVFFNLQQRGIDTDATAGAWDATFATFGRLYGGLEVTATAQAPGELESLPSAPCYVTHVAGCSDGFDNDGDGLVDFPADPGCSSPSDGDERDPQCSDGLDNDTDGFTDWPADPECTGPDDQTELGTPACGNGIDDDGDGATDFPTDTGCTSSTDRDEVTRSACSNRLDDDGDGDIDFPDDDGCHSENDDSEATFSYAPDDIRARVLLVFDTSGSMNWNVCNPTFTGGDGSTECTGGDVACATCGATGCGNGIADDSRLDRARAGVADVIAGFGDVELGLMRFHQRATAFSCPTTNATAGAGGWAGAGGVCGSFASGDLLVGFSPENEYDMLEWVDGSDNYPGTAPAGMDIELRGSGTTPLAGSLASAEDYLETVRAADPRGSCRPYRVILLTDGAETCGGNPSAAAASLAGAGYPVSVIGFATDSTMTTQLNSIASSGGTGTAIFVDDSAALSAAIADIVNDAILVERCNGGDDDCDGLIDEGFTLYCNRPTVATTSLCTDPGETLCDGIDNNCNGTIDEGLRNACGACGAAPTEVCNRVDDDCDGAIDEGGVCPPMCIPEAESCDNRDNDCDTRIDEGVTRTCGTDVGRCTVGTQTCAAGVFGACSGIAAAAETCNGIDDDCDGVIDGQTRSCGSDVGACVSGTETCVMGTFGSCVGSVGTTTEICNGIDDDCNGTVDNGNPGGGASCGTDIGRCTFGTFTCTGGTLVCTGGVGAIAELCNAIDDDCDGRTDEEVAAGATCGACGDGRMRCVAGAMACTGDRTPGTEVCNGADDDCDTRVDELNPGGGAACGTGTGACAPGTTTCTAGRLECRGGTGPATETCNVTDDDCDGIVDEGNPDGGASCGATDVGECDLGSEVCVTGDLVCVGDTGPSDERCDGLDNDCDTMVDEENPGAGAACGDDTGECQAGTTICSGGTLVCDGGVGPIEEVCNELDDDCDGVVDDGLSLGAPCGTDTGECVPGVLICEGGETVCSGELGPLDETCNALDDDCDAMVDEALPLGAECGMSEGACTPGHFECVDGRDVCVGEVPRGREVCDCEDDDCDGAIDEAPDTGMLCPTGSTCVDCACALPCGLSEFMDCPAGRIPQRTDDGMCWCVAPRCEDATCAADTVMDGAGGVVCAPDSSGVPVCACRNNECTFPCDGVVCGDGQVCHPDTGGCVTDDCRGLGCPDGEICDVATMVCVADPCATAGCAAEQACRAGTCEASCALMECGDGFRCTAGVCVPDLCEAVTCSSGEVCNVLDGSCVPNLCTGISCGAGTVCDPVTGDCERDPCADLRCPEGQMCRTGECWAPEVPVDGGMTTPDGGMRTDGGVVGGIDASDGTRRILAAGGGGCLCRVGSNGERGGGASGLMVLGLVLALAMRRRGRGGK
jgi:uncharacterized repeat protein (TIGR01451 family)